MDWTLIGNTAVTILLPIVITSLGTLATIGLKRFNSWLATREMGERMKTAVLQLSEATVAAVADLEVTMRPYMSDGKLTPNEQRQIKEAALNRIKLQAPGALQALTAAGMADLDNLINGKIETAVMALPESTKKEPTLADGDLTFFEDLEGEDQGLGKPAK